MSGNRISDKFLIGNIEAISIVYEKQWRTVMRRDNSVEFV